MNNSANRLPKIAWLSPFPPQKSGIANYSYWIVKALKPHFDIDLYYDLEAPVEELQKEFDVYPLTAFCARHEIYDEAIYHLGNNSLFHKGIYEMAWKFPGTIVLHDYNLSAFMRESFYHQNHELYREALRNGDGEPETRGFESLIQRLMPGRSHLAMSQAIVRRSKKVIVHHRWVKSQFARNDHVEVVPHFAKINHCPTEAEIKNFKIKWGIKDDHFLLACLGFINPNKLPGLQVAAVKRLLADGFPVQLIFAGEPAPELNELIAEVRSSKYQDQIIFTGYQSESDYFSAIFAADVIINLRNPSMGEASGTLMHALLAARPTIVSDANQYREFPDTVCWKLPHDENEEEVLYAYLAALLSDPNLRATISSNAANFVATVLDWEQIIARWRNVILLDSPAAVSRP